MQTSTGTPDGAVARRPETRVALIIEFGPDWLRKTADTASRCDERDEAPRRGARLIDLERRARFTRFGAERS